MNKLPNLLLLPYCLFINTLYADVYVNSYYTREPVHEVTQYTQQWLDKSRQSLQIQNWSEAIRTATIAISLDPKYDLSYVNRSWAYVEIGEYERAIEDANSALQLNSRNAKAFNNRGYAFQMSGDAVKAQRDFNASCELNEIIGCTNLLKFVNMPSLESRAQIAKLLNYSAEKIHEQNWEALIDASNEILIQAPKNITALVYRARAHAELGDTNQALLDIFEAVQRAPSDANAHHNRAYIYKLRGDMLKAFQEYKISCDLGLKEDCQTAEKILSKK